MNSARLEFLHLFTFTTRHRLHSFTNFLHLSPPADFAKREMPLKHFKSRCQNNVINKFYDRWHGQTKGDILVYIPVTVCILVFLNHAYQHVQGKRLKHIWLLKAKEKAGFITRYHRDNEIISLGFGLSESVCLTGVHSC